MGRRGASHDLTLAVVALFVAVTLATSTKGDDKAFAAVLISEIFFLFSARLHAGRIQAHNEIVWVARFALAADLAGHGIRAAFLAGAPRPFAGAARCAYHVETALVVAWPLLLALVAAAVFVGWRTRAAAVPAGAWVGLALGHVVLYPLGRERTKALLFVVELAAVGWGFVSGIRGWPKKWTSVHGVVLFLLGAELVVTLLGPFLTDIYRDWSVARVIYATTFGVLAVWYIQRDFWLSLDQ